MTPETRFDRLVDECLSIEGVTPPTTGGGFGSGALRYQKKIFAMLVRDRLVVKLPRKRVDELVAEGSGERFDANRGKPMKEWFALDDEADLNWSTLAKEALEFARR
jgi:TfoX/Sxy family transcriptional regulator of competence genes